MPQLGRSDGNSTYKFSTSEKAFDVPEKPDTSFAALMTDKPQQMLKPSAGPDLHHIVWDLHEAMIEALGATA